MRQNRSEYQSNQQLREGSLSRYNVRHNGRKYPYKYINNVGHNRKIMWLIIIAIILIMFGESIVDTALNCARYLIPFVINNLFKLTGV